MSNKTGAPPCGIYYRLKAVADKNAMGANLRTMRQMNLAINQSSAYALNNQMIEIEITEEGTSDAVELALAIIKSEGAVAIIRDDINLAGELKADGVILSDASHYSAAREALGEDAIIGIEGIYSTDTGEGADYVILPADLGAITKFSSGSEALIVSSSDSITNENCGSLARAGAHFIDVSRYILDYDKGAMQATVNVMHALELAADKSKAAVN